MSLKNTLSSNNHRIRNAHIYINVCIFSFLHESESGNCSGKLLRIDKTFDFVN